MLNTLQIFDGVKTTRDYSVVQDNSKQNWYNILTSNHAIVFSKDVNYYRLPDVIRIEARYETIRTCPYGCLILRDADGNDYDRFYFWIDHVRLLKQNAQTVRDAYDVIQSQNDVLELTIAEDVWSNRIGSFKLIDPYVVRKHMDRWISETDENNNTVYIPKYYPEAAQGVEGSFRQEKIEDLTPPVSVPSAGGADPIDVNMRYIIISAVKSSGELVWLIGCDCRYVNNPGYITEVWHDHANNIPIFDMTNVLDGSIYTAAGISANHVQSISVVPYMGTLNDTLIYETSLGNDWFRFQENAAEFYPFNVDDNGTLAWIELSYDMRYLYSLMYPILATPDVVEPVYTNDYSQGYDEQMEPMLYMSPARVRKIVNGTGGTVFDLPDIDAFEKNIAVWNSFDVNSTITFIFAGTDIKEANAIGAAGYLVAATLPIFESAWKTYSAIEKVGDEIAYNAKQMQTIANGAAGTASNAIMGGVIGGALGAGANIITGIVGTGTAMYGNEEELRAKQTVIKNSPCTMKSGGSGLGGCVLGMVDAYYMTLKIDDVSYEKLQDQYYFYGYYINNVIRGELSLHRRYLFDHVQTAGARVSGAISGDDAKEIADIFNRGVTIYHSTDGYAAIGAGRVEENYEVNAP